MSDITVERLDYLANSIEPAQWIDPNSMIDVGLSEGEWKDVITALRDYKRLREAVTRLQFAAERDQWPLLERDEYKALVQR